MNNAFNTALRQSQSIKKDLALLQSPTDTPHLTPAALGALSASLTAFSRQLDDYGGIARAELSEAKRDKAHERIRAFRAELTDFRAQLDALKGQRDEQDYVHGRSHLLGSGDGGAGGNRRPYATSSTPDNPYASSCATAAAAGYGHQRNTSTSNPSLMSTTAMGSGDVAREQHALREQSFFSSTNAALDEYIARGQAVLSDLGEQREILKGTQRRLYTVANTLGVSGETIRMVERRAREDKWIFWAGIVVFFGFCWLCLRFLR